MIVRADQIVSVRANQYVKVSEKANQTGISSEPELYEKADHLVRKREPLFLAGFNHF